ncbi:DgyrCDS5922 [Dimorphilus gyrociliatus]|uniref:WW domain-containing oxidoreductase n=1 Tax=Dimorphilus gyrociliatus TaxID=2664684 RepID=A0A7I8VR94_9ANNE|nr:DgyrCDS5922 [Dimorphilus gyrociliatus]
MDKLAESDSDDDLPSGWEERVTTNGKVYYANHQTQETQWEHPYTGKKKRVIGDLPYGWELTVSDQGLIVYVDHINQKTTFTDPRLAFAIEDDSYKFVPLKCRFDSSTTTLQLLHGKDLTGKYIIVTGASSGLGYETAKSLALHGAHVTMGCRDVKKAELIASKMIDNSSKVKLNIYVKHLDLNDLKSVKCFAQEYISQGWPLNVLILNAGEMFPPFQKTVDGFERTFQSHYLGHFYLCKFLENLLVASGYNSSENSRIVAVTCEAHWQSKIQNASDIIANTLNPQASGYCPLEAYCNANLCKLLLVKELNRRMDKKRRQVICHAVHPGNMIYTSIFRHSWWLMLAYTLCRPFTKSKEQGAATIVYAATSRQASRLLNFLRQLTHLWKMRVGGRNRRMLLHELF